jgi:hypothetical protein
VSAPRNLPICGQLIAIHIKTDTTSTAGTPATPIPDKTRYLHYDNLGSIDTITDGQYFSGLFIT